MSLVPLNVQSYAVVLITTLKHTQIMKIPPSNNDTTTYNSLKTKDAQLYLHIISIS